MTTLLNDRLVYFQVVDSVFIIVAMAVVSVHLVVVSGCTFSIQYLKAAGETAVHADRALDNMKPLAGSSNALNSEHILK